MSRHMSFPFCQRASYLPAHLAPLSPDKVGREDGPQKVFADTLGWDHFTDRPLVKEPSPALRLISFEQPLTERGLLRILHPAWQHGFQDSEHLGQ